MVSSKRDKVFRLLLAGGMGCLIFVAQVVRNQEATQASVSENHRDEIVGVLKTYFPAEDLGGNQGREPSINQVRRRIDEFNLAHALNPAKDADQAKDHTILRVLSVGDINPQKTPMAHGFRFEVQVPSETEDVVVVLDAVSPIRLTALQFSAPALFVLIAGLLTWAWPRAQAYNQYPHARDLSVIFDRKVSAGERWGFYRLSHLGGGGSLPGLQSNDWQICNDPLVLREVFDDVKNTADAVAAWQGKQQGMLPSRRGLPNLIAAELAEASSRLVQDLPSINCPEDVTTKFRPYIREVILQSVLLPLHSAEWWARLTGSENLRIDIKPPPLWLIGGYEIYFPRSWFEGLLGEIEGGLRAAHSASFDSITVAAHQGAPYINIDFNCGQAQLGPGDVARLHQYLRNPYEGGLRSMVKYMDGFGNVRVIGSQNGFDLTALKRVPDRVESGVSVHLSFRRITPSELEPLRHAFNRSRMS